MGFLVRQEEWHLTSPVQCRSFSVTRQIHCTRCGQDVLVSFGDVPKADRFSSQQTPDGICPTCVGKS